MASAKHLYDPTTRLRYDGEIKATGDPARSFQPHGEGRLYDGHGQTLYEGYFKEGQIYHGRYFGNMGQLVYEGAFENGDFHGKGRLYNDQGKLDYEGFFKAGIPHGLGRSYHNGVVEHEGQFIKGIPDGLGKSYDKQGNLQFEGMFKDGRMHKAKDVNRFSLPEEAFVLLSYDRDQVPVYKFPALGEPCTVNAATLSLNDKAVAVYMVPENVDVKQLHNLIDYHASMVVNSRAAEGTFTLTAQPDTPEAQLSVLSDRPGDHYRQEASIIYSKVSSEAFTSLAEMESSSLVYLTRAAGRQLSSMEIEDLSYALDKLLFNESRLSKAVEVLEKYDDAKQAVDALDKPFKTLLRDINKGESDTYQIAQDRFSNVSKELAGLGINDREDFMAQFSDFIKTKESFPLHQLGLENLKPVVSHAISGVSKVNRFLSKSFNNPTRTASLTKSIIPAR